MSGLAETHPKLNIGGALRFRYANTFFVGFRGENWRQKVTITASTTA